MRSRWTGYSGVEPAEHAAPALVFSDNSEGADAHGAALTKHGSYLWIADRGRNFLWVVDTATDAIVNIIPLDGRGVGRSDTGSRGRVARTAAMRSCRCEDRFR